MPGAATASGYRYPTLPREAALITGRWLNWRGERHVDLSKIPERLNLTCTPTRRLRRSVCQLAVRRRFKNRSDVALRPSNNLTQEDHLGPSPRRDCELLEFRGGGEIGCSHKERIAGTY